MTGRATTPEAKRAIVDRLLRAWLAAPKLRLGQLLIAAREHRVQSVDPFQAEDEALAALAEELSPLAPHDLTSSDVALAKMLAAWDAHVPPPFGFDDEHADAIDDVAYALERYELIEADRLSPTGVALVERARKAGVL